MATARKTEQRDITANILTESSGTPYGLELVFSNGNKLAITAGQLSADIRAYGLIHGLKQKLVDAAAIARDPETGRAATIDTKEAAVREVHARLLSGEWNKRREGGSGGGNGGLLYRALVRMYAGKKTAEEIRGWLDGKTDAEQAALRKNSKIAAIIEEIRAEQARDAGVDTNDLLAELDADEAPM